MSKGQQVQCLINHDDIVNMIKGAGLTLEQMGNPLVKDLFKYGEPYDSVNWKVEKLDKLDVTELMVIYGMQSEQPVHNAKEEREREQANAEKNSKEDGLSE